MAHPQIAAFARLADGATQAVRKIEGQKALLGRTMHSIVYDPAHDEISVPQDFADAILTFRGGAGSDEGPIRILQGPKTLLNGPERHTIDWVNNETYVPQGDEVLVFDRAAAGDAAPKRILKGPDTKLGADGIGIDPIHDLLVLVGTYEKEGLKIRIYPRTANGNVKPIREIGGKNSRLTRLGGPFALNPKTSKIILTIRPGEESLGSIEDSFVGVWDLNASGDVPPEYTFGGPGNVLLMPRGVALNEKNKDVIVTDKRLNAILTFHVPEVF